jgi:putative nucleotidyltransferase with HDIG domain
VAVAAAAGLSGYCAVPLRAQRGVVGVLELFHRGRPPDEPRWETLAMALAGRAALAVDAAQLFEELRRSNLELALAYEQTIEGWSRALDLRDKETEGHTQRVTELTVRLARRMGIGGEELTHIRRGALLHDIGKMGVPDRILLKPDRLADDEWMVMRQHPIYAYRLLSPIRHLRQALDIPYCHHERWNGAGYPRGLAGEEIPRAARIFAVADVWDALTSDRPYRPAWSDAQALAHIEEGAGVHFDPRVVEVFLSMAAEGRLPRPQSHQGLAAVVGGEGEP